MKEIRRRVEELLAKQYPGLQIKIHSAVLMKGEGIALRGLSIIDPAAEGPGPELLSYDECFLACSTDLSDLCSGQLKPTRVIVRRPTLRMTRRPDGSLERSPLVAAAETRRRRVAGGPLRERHDRDLRSHQGGGLHPDPSRREPHAHAHRACGRPGGNHASPADPGHGHRRLFPPGDFRRRGRSRPARAGPHRHDRRRGDFARDAQRPARCLRLQSFRAGLVARADRGPLPGRL